MASQRAYIQEYNASPTASPSTSAARARRAERGAASAASAAALESQTIPSARSIARSLACPLQTFSTTRADTSDVEEGAYDDEYEASATAAATAIATETETETETENDTAAIETRGDESFGAAQSSSMFLPIPPVFAVYDALPAAHELRDAMMKSAFFSKEDIVLMDTAIGEMHVGEAEDKVPEEVFQTARLAFIYNKRQEILKKAFDDAPSLASTPVGRDLARIQARLFLEASDAVEACGEKYTKYA